MSMLTLVLTIVAAAVCGVLAVVGVLFYGAWAWEVLEELRASFRNRSHHAMHF